MREQKDNSEVETPRQQAANDARENFLEQMDQVFSEILEDKTNIQPLTYVPAGTRIIVYPNVDLWLRSARNEDDVNDLNRRDLLIDDKAPDKTGVDTRYTEGGQYNNGAQNSDVLYQSEQNTTPKLLDDSKGKNNNGISGSVPPPPPSSIGLTPSAPVTTTSSPKPGVEGSGENTDAPETDDSVVKLI